MTMPSVYRHLNQLPPHLLTPHNSFLPTGLPLPPLPVPLQLPSAPTTTTTTSASSASTSSTTANQQHPDSASSASSTNSSSRQPLTLHSLGFPWAAPRTQSTAIHPPPPPTTNSIFNSKGNPPPPIKSEQKPPLHLLALLDSFSQGGAPQHMTQTNNPLMPTLPPQIIKKEPKNLRLPKLEPGASQSNVHKSSSSSTTTRSPTDNQRRMGVPTMPPLPAPSSLLGIGALPMFRNHPSSSSNGRDTQRSNDKKPIKTEPTNSGLPEGVNLQMLTALARARELQAQGKKRKSNIHKKRARKRNPLLPPCYFLSGGSKSLQLDNALLPLACVAR